MGINTVAAHHRPPLGCLDDFNSKIFLNVQVWSEVNQAVLGYENRESTPKLAKLLKLLLWAQNELDQKKVKYPKMTDLSKGTIEDPK